VNRDDEETLERLRQAARDVGFVEASERHLVLDLSVFERGETDIEGGSTPRMADGPSRAVASLRLARRLRAGLDAGYAGSVEELGERYGCTG